MKIVTDSASDLPNQEIESLGVNVVPLYIHFPEGQVSSDELTADEFYTRLRAMEPKIPTTAQPSSGQFAEIYRKLAESGEEIFSIHISSGLSGTIESARLGAQQATNAVVEFFDTMTLSGGERFHVLATALAIKAGWGKQAILERLKKIRAETEVAYTLETLTYLARGGRIGRVQALAGSLLKIKPVIYVDKKDGKYSTLGRDRTITQALDRITNYLATVYGTSRALWVTVLHGQFQEQASVLAEMLKARLKIGKLEVLRISPVLGVHTGPGIVGAAVVPMELMEDLLA
jgi:DegV family protein with EDD domain